MTTFYMLPESQREKKQCKKMLPPQHQQIISSALYLYFQVTFYFLRLVLALAERNTRTHSLKITYWSVPVW